jgi:hypothetical protein
MILLSIHNNKGSIMNLATITPTEVARPLRSLVQLIKENLQQGDEAAANAGLSFYMTAGEMLLEAKQQLEHGEFTPWLKRNDNFDRSTTTLRKYMELAEQKNRAQNFSSINAFHKATGHKGYVPNKPRPQAWHDPVKEAIGKVNVEALKQDALAKQEERALQRKLALSLIDIGFKALASKLHPDKGGSREAMVRLNRVRELLKGAVT